MSVFQEGDGEMEVSSLRTAQPSCHPIKLESCWRWVIIAYILKIWVFEAWNEGVHCWLGKSALKMSSGICSVLLELFSLCFPGIHLPFSSDSPPRWPHPTCPTPTANYCFNSRAKSCSECLQAGKGCAYCREEVRGENSRNNSSKKKVVGSNLCVGVE